MPGQVEPVGEQLADADQARDVGLAVEAGAAGGAVGVDQAAALVDAKVLDLHRGHAGSHRDREHAVVTGGHGSSEKSLR